MLKWRHDLRLNLAATDKFQHRGVPGFLPAVTIAGNVEVRLSMFIERPHVPGQQHVTAVRYPRAENDPNEISGPISSRSRALDGD